MPDKWEITLEQILNSRALANIRFEDLCRLLISQGFRERIKGSHHIFTRTGVVERITLQRDGNKAKAYRVRQVKRFC